MKDEKVRFPLVRLLMLAVLCMCGFVLSAVFCGCASTGHRIDAASPVLEHQSEIDRSQARINYLVGRVDAATESIISIRERAEGITGDIDEVIREFGEYQRGVELLLRYYKELRDAVAPEEEDCKCAPAHSYYIDSDEVYRDGSVPDGYQSTAIAGYSFIEHVPVTWLNYDY